MNKKGLAWLISGTLAFSSCAWNSNMGRNSEKINNKQNISNLCKDNKYDLDTRCMDSYEPIDKMLNSSYILKNQALYDVPEDTPERIKTIIKDHQDKDGYIVRGWCTAFNVKKSWPTAHTLNEDKYLLTAQHCIRKPKDLNFFHIGQNGYEIITIKLSKHRLVTDIDNKSLVTNIVEQKEDGIDAALLKVQNVSKDYKFHEFEKANLKKMKPGNLVYQVGNMEAQGIQLKKGIISRVDKPKILEILNKKKLDEYNFHGSHFMLDLTIHGGDSGSPVYLIKDGKPEVAGIVTKGLQKSNFILSIDEVIKSLELHKKGLL